MKIIGYARKTINDVDLTTQVEQLSDFVRQFPNANVIFIEASQGTREKADFIKGLKEELRNRSIPTKSLKEDATVESLKAVLRADRENIFIPTSGSNITLIKILPQLTLLVREMPVAGITATCGCSRLLSVSPIASLLTFSNFCLRNRAVAPEHTAPSCR